MKTGRKKKRIWMLLGALGVSLLTGCGNNGKGEAIPQNGEIENSESAEEEQDEKDASGASAEENGEATAKIEVKPGATVVADENSPSGYTVYFAYEKTEDTIEAVRVSGNFIYINPEQDVMDKDNNYKPEDYVNGMYASSLAPGNFVGAYNQNMEYDEASNCFVTSFPITSGSFSYQYKVTYADGNILTIDDPVNPSPTKENPNSNSGTDNGEKSVVYGYYDEEKQSQSPDLDFVLPYDGEGGTLTYVEYTGSLSEDQDLGIYVPAGYDPNREVPYRVAYVSHGGGENETDWFAMGHIDHIVENLGADIILVTMDNAVYAGDFKAVENNILNYVIPYMEKNYNVSTEVSERAFCGLSMGAMATFHMYFEHPEAFGYFGAFSAADMSAVSDEIPEGDAVFFITVGTCDIASSHVRENTEGSNIKYEDFIGWLEEHPSDKVIDGGYIKGAHDWFTWSTSFKIFIDEVCGWSASRE